MTLGIFDLRQVLTSVNSAKSLPDRKQRPMGLRLSMLLGGPSLIAIHSGAHTCVCGRGACVCVCGGTCLCVGGRVGVGVRGHAMYTPGRWVCVWGGGV